MLDKKIFSIGVGKIVSLLNSKYNNVDNLFFDTLYHSLSDLNNDFFILGIDNLIKSEKFVFFPSVKLIRDYVFKAEYMGYSLEELLDLAKVKELTKMNLSNSYLNHLITNINVEASTNQEKLILKQGYYNAISQWKNK